MKIIAREIPPRAAWALEQAGIHPLLARLYAARGVLGKDELDDGLARLLPPSGMRGLPEAAMLLADAMAAGQKLCIVADYDCDGATACAVAMRGLRLLGATNLDYLVPDRVVDGYGLTPPIAQRVKDRGADILITVDNGIASVEGVAAANALGLKVLVTDHHLPGLALPEAAVIVNLPLPPAAMPPPCRCASWPRWPRCWVPTGSSPSPPPISMAGSITATAASISPSGWSPKGPGWRSPRP